MVAIPTVTVLRNGVECRINPEDFNASTDRHLGARASVPQDATPPDVEVPAEKPRRRATSSKRKPKR